MIMTQPPPAELPLQLLGAIVALKLTTGDTLSGEIFCYDMKVTNTIVLKEAIDVTHANFHFIKTNHIREVSAKTLPPICVPNVYLPPCSPELLNSREKNALASFQRMKHTIGIHVSQEAQDIFNFIHKTHPDCCWSSENKICVMGVTVSPPYQQENCEGSGKALERIKQVVEKFHQRRRLDVKKPTEVSATQSVQNFHSENQTYIIPPTTNFGQGPPQSVVFVDQPGVRVAGSTTDGRVYSYPGSSNLYMMVLPRTSTPNHQDERIVSGLPLTSNKAFASQGSLGHQVFQASNNFAIRTSAPQPLVFATADQGQQYIPTTSTTTVDEKLNSAIPTGPLEANTASQPFFSTTAPTTLNCNNVSIPSSPSTYQQNMYSTIPASAEVEHYTPGGVVNCVSSFYPTGTSTHFNVSPYHAVGTLIQHPSTTKTHLNTNGNEIQTGNSNGQAYAPVSQYHKHKWNATQIDHNTMMPTQTGNASIGLPSMYPAKGVSEPVINEGTSNTSPPLTNGGGGLPHEHELLGTTSTSAIAPSSSIINATHLPTSHTNFVQRGNRKPSRSQRNRGNRRRD